MRITSIILQAEDITNLEEMVSSVTEKLDIHKSKHIDFSYNIDIDYEKKELTMKTMYMEEEIN